MRTHLEPPARVSMWIGGIAICLMATLGFVAIVRSIPVSYASIPDEGAPTQFGAAPTELDGARAENPPATLAGPQTTSGRRSRVSCPECGVIKSMRQIVDSGDFAGLEPVDGTVAGGVSGGAPGSAMAADAMSVKRYEFTVRLRSGRTIVFNEATPRAWRTGSRVIVIGGLIASNN